MPLKSKQFKGVTKLEACLVSDPDHVLPGARGEHVRKIQEALMILGAGTIRPQELKDGFYGASTVECVLNFKGPPRNIINHTYQFSADNIVGKMTIAALDNEMFEFENRPPPAPILFSLYVSVDERGEVHDHAKCRTAPYVSSPGRDGHAQHRGSPIFPKRTGRMINIWGEAETDYLGFRDYATHRDGAFLTPLRPLTQTIPGNQASDICIRSSPVHRVTGLEIQRIAQQGCRFTYASNSGFIPPSLRQFINSIGHLIEKVLIPSDPGFMEAFVVECDINRKWRTDLLPVHTR